MAFNKARASIARGKNLITRITVTSGTSVEIDLPGIRSFVVFDVASVGVTATLQVRTSTGVWANTPLTLAVSNSNPTMWDANQLAPYSAGGAGNDCFRILFSSAVSVEIVMYGN